MAWTHVADTFPVAKKRHRCVACLEFIEVGEKHLSRFGYDDDGPVTSRWHPECEEYAFIDGPDYDLTPGSFSREEAKEWISPPKDSPE